MVWYVIHEWKNEEENEKNEEVAAARKNMLRIRQPKHTNHWQLLCFSFRRRRRGWTLHIARISPYALSHYLCIGEVSASCQSSELHTSSVGLDSAQSETIGKEEYRIIWKQEIKALPSTCIRVVMWSDAMRCTDDGHRCNLSAELIKDPFYLHAQLYLNPNVPTDVFPQIGRYPPRRTN